MNSKTRIFAPPPRGLKFWPNIFFSHKKYLESPETCRKKIWAKKIFDPTPSWPGPVRIIAVAWQKLGRKLTFHGNFDDLWPKTFLARREANLLVHLPRHLQIEIQFLPLHLQVARVHACRITIIFAIVDNSYKNLYSIPTNVQRGMHIPLLAYSNPHTISGGRLGRAIYAFPRDGPQYKLHALSALLRRLLIVEIHELVAPVYVESC